MTTDTPFGPKPADRHWGFDEVMKLGGFLVIVVTLLEKAPVALGALAVVFITRRLLDRRGR